VKGNEKNILITGVAGFLGSNLLDRLMADDHTVVGIDNLSMGRIENIVEHMDSSRFQFIQDDITDSTVFDNLQERFDCVVHLAAYKIPRYGNALDTLHINYQGSDNVLAFAARTQCKCVLASTSDVYGVNPSIPFSEEDVSVIGASTVPRWAYAVSKLFDEHLAFAYQEKHGFPVVPLRFFGSYGPRQHLSWWGGPPPVFIAAALRGETIPVHGDGKQTRSFTYVRDTVDGIQAAIFNERANGEVINIGSTHEISILELARTIYRLCGPTGEARIEFVPYESFSKKRYEDVRRRVPDIDKCARILGVSAQVGLEEGLRETIQWQRAATAGTLSPAIADA
jgi:UDP-glucose 4-epimerase